MAARLLAHDVSDLCIGKPPVRPLPLSATIGEALLALRRCGGGYLSVWADKKGADGGGNCVGKICMVDVVCHLCSEGNRGSPSAALISPVSVLLRDDSGEVVRHVQRHSSMLEALDAILDGAQNLMVPLRRKKPHSKTVDFCCLTPEDFVRFFLNSIGAFSPAAALSVESLGIVRRDFLAVRHHEPALSAVPLIKRALASQTAVAVVTHDGKLIGEISPSTLAHCDETVAAAVAVLSTGELMAYLDCADPPEEALREVDARLRERGMEGLLELVGDEAPSEASLSSSLSSSGSSSASSSDEESAAPGRARRVGAGRSERQPGRMGRGRSEEAVVCNEGSSLVAVLMRALAHRVCYVWVVEEDGLLVGVVTFADVLKVFRELLRSFEL